MKRNLLLCICGLVLVSSSFGSILIGDFEGSMDGWYDSGAVSALTATGATSGTGALQAVKASGGWGGTIELGLFGTPAQAALATIGQVTVDVTTFTNDFPDGYSQMGILVNSDAGWIADDWHDITFDTTETITFQLTAAQMSAMATSTSWTNIGFISNTGSLGATYYMDNIQVVPEPATLSILALGGLSLLKRRKH